MKKNKNNMYIPKTIKVGYNNRTDTYTKKLAYVTYIDDKGVHRKKNSWDSWRNHDLGCDDFDNEPTSGFVLNKGVGGVRQSYGRNARNEYIRIYDPRNFEFEISVENLLFILQECSSIKGKGLEGEFVYSWRGTELVLLPVASAEYQECVKHTERQKVKFDKSQIAEGCAYIMKDGTKVVYLGHLPYNNVSPWNTGYLRTNAKKHIFAKLDFDESTARNNSRYIIQTGFKNIAELISSDPVSDYPDIFSEFKASNYNGTISSISLEKFDVSNGDDVDGHRYLVKENDKYYPARIMKRYSSGYFNYYSYNKLYVITQSLTPVDIDKINPEKFNDKTLGNLKKSSEKTVDLHELKKLEIYMVTVVTDGNRKLKVM